MRKHNNYDSVEVYDIECYKNGFVIRWISPELGWGEYTIHVNADRDEYGSVIGDVSIEGDSEYMDSNDDKLFLRTLLAKLEDKIEIKS